LARSGDRLPNPDFLDKLIDRDYSLTMRISSTTVAKHTNQTNSRRMSRLQDRQSQQPRFHIQTVRILCDDSTEALAALKWRMLVSHSEEPRNARQTAPPRPL
jgi:hypothetical protein